MSKDKLTGSEAIFGFIGWLTSRKKAVTFSATNDAAPAAELADEFCKANDLPEPRENWTDNLTQPKQAV